MLMNRRSFIKISTIGSALTLLPNKSSGSAERNQNLNLTSSIGVKKPFTFAVVADPHCAEQAKENIQRYGNGVTKFLACVKEMEKLNDDEKPDFILIVGDIHLWALKQHLDKVSIPMHVISGNHETAPRKKEMRDMFPADFIKNGREADYYSFVHKQVRFIGLCDARGEDHIGTFCSEDFGPRGQCEWLEEQLAQTEQHKIIFAHIPPEPQGRDRNMYISRNDSRYLNQLVQNHQPTAMFFGHQHRETQHCRIDKTESFIVRSCCWNGDKTPLGFMLVKIDNTGISTREIFTGHYQQSS